MSYKFTHHPEYLSSLGKWHEISDFRDGDTDRVLGYLIPFDSERADTPQAKATFHSRQRRLSNENDIAPIADVHLSHLSQPINFGKLADNPQLATIIADADGEGTSEQRLVKDLLSGFLDHGKAGLLVDGTDAIATTRAEVEATGERSYQVLFSATQIRYWAKFKSGRRRGQLAEVVLDAEPRIDADGKSHGRLQRFYFEPGVENNPEALFQKQILELAEPGDIEATESEIELIVAEEAIGSLPEIPFVLFGRGLADSILRMPAQMNKALLNDRSHRDNIHYYQAHQRLVATGCGPEDIKAMAEYTVTCIENEQATIQPIPASDPASLTQKIAEKEIKLKRYGMKRLNELVSASSAQVQSADSKALDQKALIAWYDEVLDELQKFLVKVFIFHMLFEGVTEEPSISVPRDYGLDDPQAIRSDRSVIFSEAGALGADDVQKQILKQQLQEMPTVIPDEDETQAEALQRLMDSVDTATKDAPLANAGRPSISDQIQ